MKTITLSVIALCLLILVMPAGIADGQHSPRVVAEKTSLPDLLYFLGIHSWKVRVIGPLHNVSVEVDRYVRAANGQFVMSSILDNKTFGWQSGVKDVAVVVMLQDTGSSNRFQLAIQSGGSPPIDFPKSLLAGYTSWGDGSGGEGLKVGDEDILMAKYYNPRVITPSKKDMSAYVALRVVARK